MTPPRSHTAGTGQPNSAAVQDPRSDAYRAAETLGVVMEQNMRMDKMLRQLIATKKRTAGAQEDEETRLQKDLEKKYESILSLKLSKFNAQNQPNG